VELPPDTIPEVHVWRLYFPSDLKRELACSCTSVLRGIGLSVPPASCQAQVFGCLEISSKEKAYSETGETDSTRQDRHLVVSFAQPESDGFPIRKLRFHRRSCNRS